MRRVLLVSGRFLLENPYRELRLKAAFETRGVEVRFALPSRDVNSNGYPPEWRSEPVFAEAGANWLNSVATFRHLLRGCDAAVFGSWKSYRALSNIARRSGRLALNYGSTSGLDHWGHGVDYACVKSPYDKRRLLYMQTAVSEQQPLSKDQIAITGSLIHEGAAAVSTGDDASRESFCRERGLDPAKPIAVLFPKGIGSFASKVGLWFPDWSSSRRTAYCQWLLDKYAEICEVVREAGWNLVIKMHPTAYTSYMCRSDAEYAYWERFPWGCVAAPQDTRAILRNADCGLGITTHSALDLAYLGKPFIYVDSDAIEPPPLPAFRVRELCTLPAGPSSHWGGGDRVENPWFPSWIGLFARAKELGGALESIPGLKIPESDLEAFVSEFWHRADGRAADRIADVVLSCMDEHQSRFRRMLSWSRYRRRRSFEPGLRDPS